MRAVVDEDLPSRRCLAGILVYCLHDTLSLMRHWMHLMVMDDDLLLDLLVWPRKEEEEAIVAASLP